MVAGVSNWRSTGNRLALGIQEKMMGCLPTIVVLALVWMVFPTFWAVVATIVLVILISE